MEEMQELIAIAGRLRQVLLQHLGLGDQAPSPDHAGMAGLQTSMPLI